MRRETWKICAQVLGNFFVGPSTLTSVRKIFHLLTGEERFKAFALLILVLVMALLDVFGVASIMPFMALLANPELLETNRILAVAFALANVVGINEVIEFQLALGFMVFALLTVSLSVKAFTSYALLRFALMREYSLGKRLVEGFLRQPYSWFLSRHSSDLTKTVVSEVGLVITQGLLPIMELVAQSLVVLALITLLIAVDPLLTLWTSITLGSAYFLIFTIVRRFLSRIGVERLKANENRYKALGNAFGALKEVKISGRESVFVQRFEVPAKIYAQNEASAQIIGQLPRYGLEIICFGGLILIVLYSMLERGDFAGILPAVSLYALAGYRMMPALQKIYVSATQLRFVGPSLDAVYADYSNLANDYSLDCSSTIKTFDTDFSLSNVTYQYPGTDRSVLTNVNLKIPAGTVVGVVGPTGSGKTTAVDLMLGMLQPQAGILEVDGRALTRAELRAWQRNVGYVPQQIYLMDDSISANIAFGIDSSEIDQKAVEHAAKVANLHDFVEKELPLKYQTRVGERGIRLSGGQRQRIGIARAIYHRPQLIIFDEATSALDNLSERAVMDAAYGMGGDVTVVIVAHRLDTVRKCDLIFLFEKGNVRAQGTFSELLESDDLFRDLVGGDVGRL